MLLPSSDQEEEGEDDEEGEATNRCCDDDQHLALVGSNVWCWKDNGGSLGRGVGLGREHVEKKAKKKKDQKMVGKGNEKLNVKSR